jgi:hypothetical protein
MSFNVEPTRAPEATYYNHGAGPVLSLNWQYFVNQRTFVEVRGGLNSRHVQFEYRDTATEPPTFDYATNENTGSIAGQQQRRYRYQGTASVSHFRDWGGQHDFKAGFDYVFMHHLFQYHQIEGQTRQLTAGVPTFVVFTSNYPNYVGTWRDTYDYGMFVQDNWSLNRVTFNLGVRFDRGSEVFPEQHFAARGRWPDVLGAMVPEVYAAQNIPRTVLASWPSVSPRLGATIDIPSARKTAVKLGFATYQEGIYGNSWLASWPGTGSSRHRWNDLNGNLLAEPGEFGPPISVSAPPSIEFPDSDRPYWDEYSIGLEREVMADLSVGARFVLRENKNIFETVDVGTAGHWLPVSIFDGGPDGVRGTADDVGPVQAFDVEPAYVGKQRTVSMNPEGASRRYRALEITADKRLSHNWQMYSSFVVSKSVGNYGQGYAATQSSGVFLDPNARINGYGLLDMDSTYQVKVGGSYDLPYGLVVAGNYFGLSGGTWARRIRVTQTADGRPLNATPVTILAEPRGSRRLPSRREVNANVQKRFRFSGNGGTLTLRIDGYNILNQMAPLSVFDLSGATFGRYQSYAPPGFWRFGAEWTF